jgi:8-hydroxy-5-deazaflavin:NADPH oxidoreductase
MLDARTRVPRRGRADSAPGTNSSVLGRHIDAFNTTFGNTVVPGEVAGQQLGVLIAGDDETAKRKVAELVRAGGMRPIDVGPLRRARQLEQLGFPHISLQDRLDTGFRSAVKFIW